MADVYDRVKETTQSTGTGAVNLLGAVTGFQRWASTVGNGNTGYYAIIHRTLGEWEVGIGTLTTGSPDSLARTTVLASSNGGAAVTFSAGVKDVALTYPAGRAVLSDRLQTFTAEQRFDADLRMLTTRKIIVENLAYHASNFERGQVRWGSNVLHFEYTAGGTGASRTVKFGSDNTSTVPCALKCFGVDGLWWNRYGGVTVGDSDSGDTTGPNLYVRQCSGTPGALANAAVTWTADIGGDAGNTGWHWQGEATKARMVFGGLVTASSDYVAVYFGNATATANNFNFAYQIHSSGAVMNAFYNIASGEHCFRVTNSNYFFINSSGVSIGQGGLLSSSTNVLAIANGTLGILASDAVALYAADFASGDSRLFVLAEKASSERAIIGNGALFTGTGDQSGSGFAGTGTEGVWLYHNAAGNTGYLKAGDVDSGYHALVYAGLTHTFWAAPASGEHAVFEIIGTLGSIICGKQAALATNATDGFLYIPTMAGAASGTATAYTGKVPLVYDSTNNKIGISEGGGTWIWTAALS